jgi:hypothetical protein
METDLQLPVAGVLVPVKLRLRAPAGYKLKSARVDGRDWRDFNPQEETVTLPAGSAGKMAIETTFGAN